MNKTPSAHSLKGFGYLVLNVLVLIFIFGVLSPRFVALSKYHQEYGEVQEQYNLQSGRIQYTELETYTDTRHTIRNGMARVVKPGSN